MECGDGITLVVLVWWYGNGGDTDVSGVVMIMSTVVTLHTCLFRTSSLPQFNVRRLREVRRADQV